MGTPNLPGIQSLGGKIALRHANWAKQIAIAITHDDLEARTENYLDSFHVSLDTPTSASVSNTAQYASILEQGSTKTWVIRSKSGKKLKFKWNNAPSGAPPAAADGFHYFNYVLHHGAKAYQILNRAMLRAVK